MKQASPEFNVLIEVPARSKPIKYEIDKASGALFVDKFLSTGMHYPCDYGYICETLNQYGSPLSALVITPIPVNQGCVIRCRTIGMLALNDEEGEKAKVLAVPIDALTDHYQRIQNFSDLPQELLQRIVHFFEHYTDLEPDKKVTVDGWLDVEAARKEIEAARVRYEEPSKKRERVKI